MHSVPAGLGRLSFVVYCMAAVLTVRFGVECVFLLPSPVADPAYFLTASENYCRSGFLGTTIYPIDPTGQGRMIWHGFVSPMFFAKLNFGCSTRGFYLTLWLIKAATVIAIVSLSKRRRWQPLAALGVAVFAMAVQTSIGFRPETLAILLVILIELAGESESFITLGALAGTLLCTQPTVAGIYGASALIMRPELISRSMPVGVGVLCMVVALISLYPFPVLDLIGGISLQAHRLLGRNDGSVGDYYLWLPSLPVWSVLLLVAGALTARTKPLILMLLPVLWFFGPRVPPVYYNLLPTCLFLLIVQISWARPKIAAGLAGAALLIGVLGFGFLTFRDLMTIRQYGDTFGATRLRVAQLAAAETRFASLTPFLALTNPELRSTDPTAKSRSPISAAGLAVDIIAVNGSPNSPCPAIDSNPKAVSLTFGGRTFFHSNSGWMIYVCPTPHQKFSADVTIAPAAFTPAAAEVNSSAHHPIVANLFHTPGLPAVVHTHPSGAPSVGSEL